MRVSTEKWKQLQNKLILQISVDHCSHAFDHIRPLDSQLPRRETFDSETADHARSPSIQQRLIFQGRALKLMKAQLLGNDEIRLRFREKVVEMVLRSAGNRFHNGGPVSGNYRRVPSFFSAPGNFLRVK